MAYDTNKLYEDAVKATENPNVYFIEDVIALMGISKPTFYEHFPIDSNEINDIKDALTKNKISKKVELRQRLSQGDKAAEILALYKLIGTEEERKKLSSTYHDLTTKGDKLNNKQDLSNLSDKELILYKQLQSKL